MKEPTQEEIQECVNNTVKQALKTLTKDTKQASYEIETILQKLQDKYETLDFDIRVDFVKGIEGTTHLCYIGVKLI